MPELLNPLLLQPGGEAIADELQEVIADAILHHPRSLQAELGPSEIGDPCTRRIAYKLLGTPERPQAPNWPATIGTATHAWLERVFDLDNLKRAPMLGGQERWYIEERVTVGYVPGVGFVTGSCDLYDRVTCTVVDWKVVGPTQLKKYRSQGASTQYRCQAHLYGQGWVNKGLPVAQVRIAFLPRNGSLDEAYVWGEDFQPAIAKSTLDRFARIAKEVADRGPDALTVLNTADAYCGHCPFFRGNSTDPREGCPGDPSSPVYNPAPALSLAPAS